jgi:1-acyl-sn-glycerol-3-phosphate acyltransferase
MKTILGYLLTPVFHFYYWMMLILFHPFQVGGQIFFGDKTRKKVVDTLNCALVRGLFIMGCRVTFEGFEKIPQGRPLIIVSNHQSLYDIPAVVCGFREFYPRFISKIELSRYYPSISYNLRKGKSALIDRKNGTQAVKEIFKVGQLIRENNSAVCIFPEGTRSKTGKVNKFQSAGINTLLHAAPSAVIIPFVIDGHSQMMQKGYYPLTFGQKISYTVLDPIEPGGQPVEELVSMVKERIVAALTRGGLESR